MLLFAFYLATVLYCLIKLSKSRIQSHVDSSHYNSDALDTIMVIVLAPFLAIIDIILSIIYYFRKSL
jgi:hypothetical protein